MNSFNARFKTTLAASLLALSCAAFGGAPPAQAAYTPPSWQSNAVIYCVFPRIFSNGGSSGKAFLAGVTSQITRLHNLGVNVIWLMPFQPVGNAGTFAGASRPSSYSPYDISNLTGIDPFQDNSDSTELSSLISAAHADNMKVILDVALNQTSWDNSLIQNDPKYYYHTDSVLTNPNTIKEGFGAYADIAWVDILNNTYGAQDYMQSVCQYWVNAYKFDGFRFDSADNATGGSTRSFPQSFAETIYNALNPNNTLMWLGEENNSALADAPYTLDYDWNVSGISGSGGALQAAAKNGNGVVTLENDFNALGPGGNGWPSTFQHMLMLQDWDTNEDYTNCGGFPQVLDAAVFNLTMPGVPLVYNGEEVGNDVGGDNTLTQIDWTSSNASKFTTFYNTMIHNRLNNSALQLNAYQFEGNHNNSVSVCTIDRGTQGASGECYVEINFSGSAISGTCTVPTGSGSWTDISPSVSPGGTSHTLPSTGNFSLAAYDYAIFKRS